MLDMTWFERCDWQKDREAVLDRVEREIGYPPFVKPANLWFVHRHHQGARPSEPGRRHRHGGFF